jgi:hypothetical protein
MLHLCTSISTTATVYGYTGTLCAKSQVAVKGGGVHRPRPGIELVGSEQAQRHARRLERAVLLVRLLGDGRGLVVPDS